MHYGKLYGVGIGPGDPQYLTLRAVDVLRAADVIFTVISRNAADSVSRNVVESLHPQGEIRLQMFTMSRDREERAAQVRANAEAIMAELKAGKNCAFATLGDAMTYSTFGYVLEIIRTELPGVEVEIVPGITSFATLAAKAGKVLAENGESLHVIPSFRAEQVEKLEFPAGSTTVLLKTYRSRAALLERLRREKDVEIIYGERLTMPGEALESEPELGQTEQYNNALEELCDSRRVGFIDNTDIVEDQYYEEDGIHFQMSFYTVWAEHMAEVAAL